VTVLKGQLRFEKTTTERTAWLHLEEKREKLIARPGIETGG